MTAQDCKPRGAGRRMLTAASGRRTTRTSGEHSAPDWPAPASIPARSAADFTVGFRSEWRKTDPRAHAHVERADLLNRIAAFTDELNEVLTRNRDPQDAVLNEEPDNASGVTVRARNIDSFNLLVDCEKALRAAAATTPA